MKLSASDIEKAYARNLGGWIQRTREDLGLSLGLLAIEIGVHRNTVWRWEEGIGMPNVYQYSLIRRLVKKRVTF